MSEFITSLWADEIAKSYAQSTVFQNLIAKQHCLVEATPWYKRAYYRSKYRLRKMCERVGAVIAGREFNDD